MSRAKKCGGIEVASVMIGGVDDIVPLSIE